jgi:Fe-Mn family superoxide dismutase
MAFSLPELPYAYQALEPVIDARTMEIHHSKHHAAYTNNLNAALEGNTAASGLDIEGILSNISTFSPAIRNNGGGFYNHNLFWTILSAGSNADSNLPVIQAIEAELGGMDSFKTSFSQAATTRFGSGWAWLSVDGQGKLFVSSTPNQDNPLMDVVDQKGTPILGLDVWEHAYYLNYQNRRPDYIQSFFTIINWSEVNRRYLAAKGA